MVAVIDADQFAFVSGDRTDQLVVILCSIIITAQFTDIARDEIATQFLVLPQHVLADICFMSKGMAAYFCKKFGFQFPQCFVCFLLQW